MPDLVLGMTDRPAHLFSLHITEEGKLEIEVHDGDSSELMVTAALAVRDIIAGQAGVKMENGKVMV